MSTTRLLGALAITLALAAPAAAQRDRSLFYSWHVGSAHPLGDLDSLTDANIHFHLDLGYAIRQTDRLGFNAKLIVGFNQFTAEPFVTAAHPHWTNISANLQAVTAPSATGLRLYVQAGGGIYKPKSGSSDPGLNVGIGFQVPVSTPFKLEFGLDVHQIQTTNPVRFYTVQIGVLFH